MLAGIHPVANFILFSIIGLTLFQRATTVPQIFTKSYKFCTFEFGEKKFNFPDKLWTISSGDFVLQFSLCNSVQNSCSNQSSSCLIQKRNRQVIKLGHEFVPGDEDDFTLTSSKGARCRSNPAKNYTLSISLQCSDAIKPKPFLMSSGEQEACTFEVAMMRPDCRPKCTETIADSHFLDLRSFKSNISVDMDSKKFSLTLCGSNRRCSKGISACEILDDNTVPLASVASQHFIYDASKNELTARGRYRHERIVRDVEVLMKCSWGTDLANAKHKKAKTQGKHYKFVLESSFGCIKLPHNCLVTSVDNVYYNLTDLYRAEGWEVGGVPHGKISMNICGSLKQLQRQSVCSEQHSQVCHVNNNKYINRGSILLPLHASDDVIRATFVSGSRCLEDPQLLYSTEVEFDCSKKETGPIFKGTKNCTMYLIWKTPRACPVDYYRSPNCHIDDRVSNRDLRKLYTAIDQIHHLAPNNTTRLIYNLCGPTHEPCGGFNNASFCLKTGQTELVIGWDNKDLISEHGQLRMELQGSPCRNRRSTAAVTAHFVCTYETPPSAPQVAVIEDSCRYNVTIFTSLACTGRALFNNCTHSTANHVYDLSALTLRNRNYVVSGHDIDYVFNLCGPVVSGPGALCRGDTMVCWRNKTEANVKHRYRSLGTVGGPSMRNGSLVVEATLGTLSLCPGFVHYKSIFHFECSKQGFAPEFMSRTDCVVNFRWKTPEACPQEKKCVIPGSKPDIELDFTKLQKRRITVNIDNETNQYEFHLCENTYISTTKGVKSTHTLKREYISYDGNPHIILDLKKTCDNNTYVTKVFLKAQCSQTADDSFEQTSYENCVLNMTLKTHILCASKREQESVYSIIEPQESKIPKEIIPDYVSGCTLTNTFTGYEFSLSKIKSREMLFNNTSFAVNLDGEDTQCGGVFCKNHTKMVASMCPTPVFNYSHHLVLLTYPGLGQCGVNLRYELNIMLKCNQTKDGGRVVKDTECKTIITYGSTEACLLLKQDIVSVSHTATGAIAGTVTALLLIVICAIIVVIKRRRIRSSLRLLPFRRDKTEVCVYTRDFTL